MKEETDKELDEILKGILEERIYLKIVNFLESINLPFGKISLYTRQVELIKHFYDNWHKSEIIINKSRQTGVSILTKCFLIDRFIKEKGKYIVLYISNSQSSSSHSIEQIGDICVMNNIKNKRNDISSIAINGNLVTNKLSDLNLYHTATDKRIVIIYDEYAHIQPKTILNIEKTLSLLNNVLRIYSSTPNGMNDFYDKCNNSKVDVFNINWKSIPNRDKNWREQQIKILGSEVNFDQEYNNKFITSK